MKCWSCGVEIKELSDVLDVHQLGLSLQGNCPYCGVIIGVNTLWKKRIEKRLLPKKTGVKTRVKSKD
jgi:hypothetical protein